MIRLLDWDSDFFGYKVGSISIENVSDINEELEIDAEFKLVYLFSKEKLTVSLSKKYSARWVDTKVVLKRKVVPNSMLPAAFKIIPYYGEDDVEIFNLALESGIYSRFNVDPNFRNNEFERLYNEWIKKSLNNTISEIVYIAYINECVAGFITIGEKNGRADIGLIAVDKEFRGRNVGLSLIEMACQYAHVKGYEEIQVVTQGENTPAMKLYSKCGFIVDDTTFVYHIWRND